VPTASRYGVDALRSYQGKGNARPAGDALTTSGGNACPDCTAEHICLTCWILLDGMERVAIEVGAPSRPARWRGAAPLTKQASPSAVHALQLHRFAGC
jgi:hypothetical protein